MSAVRDLYRQLASALHPDRASTPEDRQRRTELMQRANRAKENGDLHALMALERQLAGPQAKVSDAPRLPKASEINPWTLQRAVLTDEGWICPPW